MSKVFLSHSSKQKGFIEVVANKLGKFNITYDAWTFEAGSKTIDEIYNGIDNSGLFVYFISNEALESKWVEKEINRAVEFLKAGRIKRFLPLLIDDKVKYSDGRIPDWIREEYNIKYISKPTKCYDLIKQALRLASWDLYPKNKLSDQLFIGRTYQIKQFEERIYDFDRPAPVSLIVCGLPAIGRRKFLKHTLIKSNKIPAHYTFPQVLLDSRSSIEDLIVKLYGLGYSKLDQSNITNLTIKDINQKCAIAANLIKELYSNNDILLIQDNLAIVSKDGNVVDWLELLLNLLKSLNGIALCIVSQARVRPKYLIGKDSIFSIDIPELEIYERKALFKSLLEVQDANLNQEDFKVISNQFSGFPEQIIYTASLILSEGKQYVLDNPHEIVDYNSEHVAKLIKNYEQNELALQVLKIFSDTEFLSFNVLEDILKEDFESAKDIITQLSHEFIIEYIGNIKEFPRLNDSVKDYVQRSGYKMAEKYRENLKAHIQIAFKDYEIIDRDISDYVISFKESLKEGYDVPKQFLIPSHYVNAMRELYNRERRYVDVVKLADRIIPNEQYLDKKIVKEIRYWLCLSLARLRDKRILAEVQKIQGPDHNFLLGFYYRLIGRNEDAIQRFTLLLEEFPNFPRAKRELVLIYLNIEQYEEAYVLAKENYYADKNNVYNLQSYIRCLIKLPMVQDRFEIEKLLEDLKSSNHEKADEMYRSTKSQYIAFIEKNNHKALQMINDAIAIYPLKIYPYLSKLDLLRRSNNFLEMKSTLTEIEQRFEKDTDIFKKLPYLACKCIYLASVGDKDKAMNLLNREIKNNFNDTIYNALYIELNAI